MSTRSLRAQDFGGLDPQSRDLLLGEWQKQGVFSCSRTDRSGCKCMAVADLQGLRLSFELDSFENDLSLDPRERRGYVDAVGMLYLDYCPIQHPDR